MNLRILESGLNDLAEGRDFYEQQGEGLGGYFLDSLFSDVDSLILYAGIHRKIFGFHRLCPSGSRMRFTINLKTTRLSSIACWICARTRAKFVSR